MNVPFTVCFSLYRLLLGSASSCSSNADQFTAVYPNGASVKNIYHTWQTLCLFQILAICCGFLPKTLHIAEKHTRRGQHQGRHNRHHRHRETVCHNSRQVKIFYKKSLDIWEHLCYNYISIVLRHNFLSERFIITWLQSLAAKIATNGIQNVIQLVTIT